MPNWRTTPTPTHPRPRTVTRYDPQSFEQAFSPEFQPDEAITEEIYRRLATDGIVPFDEVIRRLAASNVPPQLVQASRLAVLARINEPVEICPKNPDRLSLIVSNFGASPGADGIVFSFDRPIQFAPGLWAGIPVPAQSSYVEANGSVSINAIWAVSGAAAGVFPIPIIAYEGALSVAGNARET